MNIEKRRPLSDSLQELEKWHAVGDIRDAFGKKAGGGAKKAINKETSASEYINHYRNWTWSAKK